MPPPLRKPARFGPLDRYLPPPAAGMCVSAFAVVRQGRKVLLGQPRIHERWLKEWVPNWTVYSKGELAADLDRWRLPSTYLFEGESPDAALGRILREQLGVRRWQAKGPEGSAWDGRSDEWYPGERHWDIVFTYRVRAAKPRNVPEWWRELRWFEPRELRKLDWGWNEDYMASLRLA